MPSKPLESSDASTIAHSMFSQMEDLCCKLQILDYEKYNCKQRHHKPIHKYYFAVPTTPGEQFYTFTAVAAWLIVKANGKIDTPQEGDDPNATIANILDATRLLGYTIDFPPSKLKSGWGEFCITVLNMLADAALKAIGFRYKTLPDPDDEEADAEPEVEEDSCNEEFDLIEWKGPPGDHFNANSCAMGDPQRMQYGNAGDDEATSGSHRGRKPPSEALEKRPPAEPGNADDCRPTSSILQSTTDPTEWQLELERVLPQLRLAGQSGKTSSAGTALGSGLKQLEAGDWRNRLDEMHRLTADIGKAFSDVKNQLTRLTGDVGKAMDKIKSREKYINSHLESTLAVHKTTKDRLADITAKYREASGGITERSRILAEITEDLERVKQEMDERGSSMTDGSPVVRIKQAIQRIKAEMTSMDIRTGVLEHMLLRTHLRLREDSQKPLFVQQAGGQNRLANGVGGLDEATNVPVFPTTY